MADVMSPDKRSALMSRIRGKNTGPELLVRRYLWHAGFRYSLHSVHLPGKPDLALPRWNAVVFVNGCFWHRHPGCPYFRLPKTRTAFWDRKLAVNHSRDCAAIASLIAGGWRVAVAWECAVRNNPEVVGMKLVAWLRRSRTSIQLEGIAAQVRRRNLERFTH